MNRLFSFVKSSSIFFLLFFINLANAQDCPTTPGEQKKWNFSGNLSLHTVFYFFDGDSGLNARSSPFTFNASANITATYKKLIIPLSITYSDMERKTRQSYNQFSIRPQWKWLNVHLGYSNLTYSDFTLSGHSVLGSGLEMNPGSFRFGFVYGRFNRTVPVTNNIFYYSPPSYTRKGYAAHIGVGNKKTFFDLIFMNVQDDSTTLPYNPGENKISPAQNLVGGFNTRFHLDKDLFFEGEGAISVITSNLKADSVNGVEDDWALSKLNTMMPVNISTEFYTALRTAIIYKKKNYSAKLQFKRIDPNYKSMGAYFFNNDMKNITFEPTAKLFRQKLILRASIGLQHDNLYNLKKATSTRRIGYFKTTLNPSAKFGLDAGISNYSTNQEAGRISIIDSIRLKQNTINFYVTPRYVLYSKDMTHTIMVNFNLTQLEDRNKSTEKYNEFNLFNLLANYTFSFIPQKVAFITGFTYTKMTVFQLDSKMIGFIGGMSKTMNNGKLNLIISSSITKANYNESKGWVPNVFTSANYKLNKKNSLNATFYFIGNYFNHNGFIPQYFINKSFTELKFDIGYVYTL